MSNPDFSKKLNAIVKQIELINPSFNLDEIFGNPTYINIFLKNKDFLKLLMRYLTTIHNDEIINDLSQYYVSEIGDEQGKELIDEYYFLNGDYSKLKITNLKENEVNEVLLFNIKKTKDEHFNEVFESVKNFDIFDYKFPYDKTYLNAKINSYNFNFLKKFYKKPQDSEEFKTLSNRLSLSKIDGTDYVMSLNPFLNPHDELEYDPEFGDSFILPYNFNNLAFKRSFFYLCSRHLIDSDLKIDNLLNGFLNFESIFYSKNVIPNDEDSNLITYIYFKASNPNTKEFDYIPNLRYTIDVPGDTTQNKIIQLKDYETIRTKFDEFETKVIFDDKGIYFSTSGYKPDEILLRIQRYIDISDFDGMLYYIFNSQFLSRSTCLFGYYIYFILTGKIPNTKRYYDIIALTTTLDEFKKSLDFKTYEYKIKSKCITLSKLLDFVMNDKNN